jgi:hypothetical protein
MNNIITLKPRATRATAPALAKSADVLFFTGIRYERMDTEIRKIATKKTDRLKAKKA